MKKHFVYIIALLLAFSFVSAIAVDSETQAKANIDTIKKLNNGSLETASEGEVQIQIMQSEEIIEEEVEMRGNQARIGNASIDCSGDCNLTQFREEDRVTLQATLSNGRNSEIKIMPEVASERAITRLQLNSCEESNCTIELKEVGKGNSTKMAYEVSAKKEAKIIGLFNARINVKAQVDAETGEIIQIKKPFWVSMKTE